MPSTQALAVIGFAIVLGLSIGGLITKNIGYYVGTLIVAIVFLVLVVVAVR
jgi:hypothetical protein